jgi:hypothetical protein
MSPKFIRAKQASRVDKSLELEAFLDSCGNEWLRDKAEEAFSQIKAHYEIGEKVQKDRWPRYYILTWGINNLFVYKVGRDWRLTYSLVSDGGGIKAFCLEILTHKEYNKRFGYKTS